MPLTQEQVLDVLRAVRYPGFSKDIVALGVVRGVRVSDDEIDIDLDLNSANPALAAPLEREVRAQVRHLAGEDARRIRVGDRSQGSSALRMAGAPRAARPEAAPTSDLIPGVRHALAVASGKGGVGKSTVAVNLATALAAQGASVGLLDADVYGPSIPLMTGIDAQPELSADGRLVPFERFGVRIMSLGFLVDPNAAVIWRGPMVMKALEQLLGDVDWGELDYLLVDMPPGTGDAQLTLAQRVRLSGAVIVTTPQDVALADARKGVAMFRKVDVPVLGIVENMSYFACPHCSQRTDIFGHGGGRAEAERLQVPFLGEVPLDPAIRTGGDVGQPIVAADPSSAQASALTAIATRVRDALPQRPNAPAG